MTISNETIRRFNETKTSIRCAIDRGIDKQTQKEIYSRAWAWIDGFKENAPKRTPKSMFVELRAYAEGYFDASVEGKTVFLYNVNGTFYKTNNSTDKDLILPVWDTLPREQWDKLGDHGGIYWKSTLLPFFID